MAEAPAFRCGEYVTTHGVHLEVYSIHNFAWLDDNDTYIHRKGATPANLGEYGIIPATMGDISQIVVGLGNSDSLNSASHGAGRTHSRGRALQEFGNVNTHEHVKKNYGIELIGGGTDEDPRAYKRIDDVMQEQESCVKVVSTFHPKLVRMAEPRIFRKRHANN